MTPRTGLGLLIASWLTLGCTSLSGIFPQPTMKGMELYSWLTPDGIWNYSLLTGTNRQKTVAEVTDPAQALSCTCKLKTQLAKLPAGEYVTWLTTLPDDTNHVLGLPPQDVVNDLTAYCQEQKLNLQIVQ